MKKKNGITLVALIVSIIVLLILATVSISLVINNGILNKAKAGVDKYSDGEIEEQIKLAYSEWQTAQWTGETKTAQEFMEKRLQSALKDDGLTVTESEGVFVIRLSLTEKYIYDSRTGKMLNEVPVSAYPFTIAGTNNIAVTENSKYTSDGKIAIIPKGYAISNIQTEQSIDTGLVITKDDNEWVWIPVSSAHLAAMCTKDNTGWTMSGTSGKDAVVTYYKTISRTEIRSDLTRGNPGTTSDREPDVLSKDNNPEYLAAAGFTSYVDMAINLKIDYENMIDSVKKYGGFYIGRYELSESGTKRNQKPLTNMKWYSLYKTCKEIDNNGVETRMIWGCQWDQVCKFVSNAKDANGNTINLANSTKYGNYYYAQSPANTGNYEQGIKKNTGSNEAWKTNNIYDLAGNCCEYTQETSNTSTRIVRGGDNLKTGGDPITYRWRMPLDNTGATSRPSLFIK